MRQWHEPYNIQQYSNTSEITTYDSGNGCSYGG